MAQRVVHKLPGMRCINDELKALKAYEGRKLDPRLFEYVQGMIMTLDWLKYYSGGYLSPSKAASSFEAMLEEADKTKRAKGWK
jgi:hypothetical protein